MPQTVGVFVSLNGKSLDNNSNITNTKGGDGLNCHSDKLNCCENDVSNHDLEGIWYSQTTEKQSNESDIAQDLTTQRAPGAISLHLDNIDQNSIGTLCCTIPDINDEEQTICINYSKSFHSNYT